MFWNRQKFFEKGALTKFLINQLPGVKSVLKKVESEKVIHTTIRENG